MSNAERFIQAFTERWRQPDPDRLAELWHPEGELLHPGMEEPIGRDQLPGYIARVLSVFPDVRLEPTAWASKGDTILVEWTMTATFRGQQIQWSGADRFTLRGDLAIEGIAYFDSLPLWILIDPSMKRGGFLAAAAPAAAQS